MTRGRRPRPLFLPREETDRGDKKREKKKREKKMENLEIHRCSPDPDSSPAGFLALRGEKKTTRGLLAKVFPTGYRYADRLLPLKSASPCVGARQRGDTSSSSGRMRHRLVFPCGDEALPHFPTGERGAASFSCGGTR
ncbi:hypothetical protein GW17_00000212 [Ensete ventricosum]|nr:hypothetical protein GW17_00000212 [Ensete ventricosum]